MPENAPQFPTLAGDSADFYNLSQNLFHHSTFSSSYGFPLIPESFRLPGYPLYLYLFDFLPHALLLAILAQIALASASVVLLYRIGKKFLSEKVAHIGAVLFSIEPTSVFFSVTVMSDPLFVFLMLLGMYLLLREPINKREFFTTMLAAGLIFGYAILTRTIAEYLTPCLLLGYVVLHRKQLRPFSVTFTNLVAFLLGTILVLLPWSLRNHSTFHTYTLSSTPYINFTQYNLAEYYAYKNHTTHEVAVKQFQAPIPYPTSSYWFRSLINEPIFQKEMADGLRGNLLPYTKFHLVKTIPFFVNDSLRDINRVVGVFPEAASTTGTINFTSLLLQKDIRGIVHYFMVPQPNMWLLLIGSLVWASVSLLWLCGLVYALVKREDKLWFLLVASGIILYFALLSSPVIQPRYRMPAAPFMLLLAADGAASLYSLLKKKRARETQYQGVFAKD